MKPTLSHIPPPGGTRGFSGCVLLTGALPVKAHTSIPAKALAHPALVRADTATPLTLSCLVAGHTVAQQPSDPQAEVDMAGSGRLPVDCACHQARYLPRQGSPGQVPPQAGAVAAHFSVEGRR